MSKNGRGGKMVTLPPVGTRRRKAGQVDVEIIYDSKAPSRILKTRSVTDEPGHAMKAAEHLDAMETQEPVSTLKIVLPKLEIAILKIKIVGDSSLICNRWSEKARKMILDKQMGIPSAGREHKVPEEDVHNSLYHLAGGGHGFPTIGFKNAAVTACTSLGKSITKVMARQAFHIVGELVKIKGEPTPREDMVRVGNGVADVRFRGEFLEWSCVLTIRYNKRVLSDQQIVNLFMTAGFAVGVGEWRAEKDGSHGLFHVE